MKTDLLNLFQHLWLFLSLIILVTSLWADQQLILRDSKPFGHVWQSHCCLFGFLLKLNIVPFIIALHNSKWRNSVVTFTHLIIKLLWFKLDSPRYLKQLFQVKYLLLTLCSFSKLLKKFLFLYYQHNRWSWRTKAVNQSLWSDNLIKHLGITVEV